MILYSKDIHLSFSGVQSSINTENAQETIFQPTTMLHISKASNVMHHVVMPIFENDLFSVLIQ